MYLRDEMYSEPIQTVNSTIVGIYKTRAKAEAAARRYFFQTLGHTDTGESDGFYCSPEDGDCGTWDEEVWVDCYTVH